MYFAGRVTLALGAYIGPGPYVEAGSLTLHGVPFNIYIEPLTAFKDVTGCLCAPAWAVPTVSVDSDKKVGWLRRDGVQAAAQEFQLRPRPWPLRPSNPR